MRQKRKERILSMGGNVYEFNQTGCADIKRTKHENRVKHANKRGRAEGGKF